MSLFQKAERKKAKLRLGLDGPSGSGKTHSALLIASGLVSGNIFLIDTERDSATLEIGKPGIPEFLHAPLYPPYTPARYQEYVREAVNEGAELIIIDSLSHAWSGNGGVLDMHDKAAKAQRSGNSWAALSSACRDSRCSKILTQSRKRRVSSPPNAARGWSYNRQAV